MSFRPATSPFDSADADIILRTSDDVDFRVFRTILSLGSPVFKDMLSLPQPPSSNPADLPVIPISETSTAIEPVLLCCYPSPPPPLDDLHDVRMVLEVSRKYDISCSFQHAAGQLTSERLVTTYPIGVYCIACHFGIESAARAAALKSLNIRSLGRPSPDVEEMELITGPMYHRLLTYHFECGKAAANITDRNNFQWIIDMKYRLPEYCSLCRPSNQPYTGLTALPVSSPLRPKWFWDMLSGIANELKERPAPETVTESRHFKAVAKNMNPCSTCISAAITSGLIWDLHDAFVKKVGVEVEKVRLEFKP